MPKIKSVFLEEPRREGEYPDGAIIGSDGVTQIIERTENYGDYAIVWFDVFKGDALFKSFGGIHVAVVTYEAQS